jgi:hypothetical protein
MDLGQSFRITVSSFVAVGSYIVTSWALKGDRGVTKAVYSGKAREIIIDLAKDDGVLMFREIKRALSFNPQHLTIELIGIANPSHDGCMACFDLLQEEQQKGLKITTVARSSLMGGSVLVWLAGNQRKIRDNAYFVLDPLEADPPWKEQSIWKSDYRELLGKMNQFFAVSEFIGKRRPLKELQDYGLMNSIQQEKKLASLFG